MAKVVENPAMADLECPHCKAPLKIGWDNTESLHHDDDSTSVQCPACERSFTITMHLRSEYKASLPYERCNGCDWADPDFDPEHAADRPGCYLSSECPVSMM